MTGRARVLPALTLLLFSLCSTAQTMTTFIEDRGLGVAMGDLRFPESLRKDLMSGLTNRLLIRVTLEPHGQRARQRSAEIAIRYDLWDEVFTCVTSLDGATPERTTKRTVREVMGWLEHIRLQRLFATNDLGAAELIVRAELLLNPIDRERMENLRKWVAENSTRRSLDPAGILGAGDASLANAIFNKIFEQYVSGSEVAAVWQQRVATPRFTLDALEHDGR